jgi:predicted RNA-binding protein YlxR (DUF448 family)
MRSQVMRMCVACREREVQKTLIRVVSEQNQLVVDHGQKALGRGAYVHPAAECIENALKRRMFVRALRVSANVDVTAIVGL